MFCIDNIFSSYNDICTRKVLRKFGITGITKLYATKKCYLTPSVESHPNPKSQHANIWLLIDHERSNNLHEISYTKFHRTIIKDTTKQVNKTSKSRDPSNGNWRSTAEIKKKRRLFFRVECARSDIIRTTGYIFKFQVNVPTSVTTTTKNSMYMLSVTNRIRVQP